MRIGTGYDVHRLVEDRKLILGGVEIPYEKGLLGHSDADVLVHAVMDALLGAAATREEIRRAISGNLCRCTGYEQLTDAIYQAAEELKKEWGIKICACEKELEVLRDSKKNLMMDYYRKDYTLEPDLTVCDGETFEAAGVTWKVIETPGHTIGSCCYYIESEDLLFAGDTLFRTSYGRVDLPTGDAMSMLASVKKLLTLPETVKVYPGHMGVTSIEYEKKHNPLARY